MNGNKNDIDLNIGIGCKFQGFYKLQVVDSKTNTVVEDYGWGKNLILNSGMDAIGQYGIVNLSRYAVAGTGSRPNYATSSTSQITQSANTIFLCTTTGLTDFTSSYSYYSASAAVGDVIVDSDNSQSNILSVVNGYNLTVDTNYTYTNPKTFTIYKTSQTLLQSEIKRSGTYLQGSSSAVGFNCGTQNSASTKQYRRTYDFSAEVTQKVYSEVAVTWSPGANTAIFSRIVPSQSVTVASTFQLRLVYDLVVTWTPYISRSVINPLIDGWNITGATESIQNFNGLYGPTVDVSTNGGAGGSYGTDLGSLDPAAWHGYDFYYFQAWISEDANPPAPYNSYTYRGPNEWDADHGGTIGWGIASYVTGSYVRYKYDSFGLNTGNSNQIKCLGLGMSYYPGGIFPSSNGVGMILTFASQPQIKLNTQILNLVYKWSWSRVIE